MAKMHEIDFTIYGDDMQFVEIELTVAATGSVDEARIVAHDPRQQYADDILDAIRVARFRPKFVDGSPVAAPGIIYREILWRPDTRE